MYKAIVITVSDRCYRGEYADTAGPAVKEILTVNKYVVDKILVVPDERLDIVTAINKAVDDDYALIVTVGGTGFSERDITPECTKEIIERETPGIAEYMRLCSMKITPRAMLSRGVCGIKHQSLIINLPGSEKAAKENLEAVVDTLEHGLLMLRSGAADCANINQ